MQASLLYSARGPTPQPSPASADHGNSSFNSFESADSALESAQSCCERGAHHFLREGECDKDIASARQHFQKSKSVSDETLARLRADQEAKQQEDAKSTPSNRPAATISSEESKESNTTLVNDELDDLPNPTKGMLLEVDEDDDNQGFNLNDPDFMKRFRVHSRRTMG